MSIKFLKLFLFTLGVLFFTGGACPSNDTTASNKVAQSEIYQSYSITQNGQNYDVIAYFRIGGKTGTTLALSAPSRVTFNGQAMQERLNTFSGSYYIISVPSDTPNGTFAFTDRNGKTYSNKIDLTKVALNSNALRANSNTPVSIPLSRQIDANTEFDVSLGEHNISVDSTPGKESEAYFDKSKNSVVILPLAWKNVAGGNIPIKMGFSNSIQTQQGTTLGGDITFKYKTSPVNVALLKVKSIANKNTALANVNTADTANTNSMAVVKNSNTNLKSAPTSVKKPANTNTKVSVNKQGAK